MEQTRSSGVKIFAALVSSRQVTAFKCVADMEGGYDKFGDGINHVKSSYGIDCLTLMGAFAPFKQKQRDFLAWLQSVTTCAPVLALAFAIVMASSSSSTCSSSSRMTWKYDVFVSFRGEDTRYNFTDHLFGALQRNNIVAFRDDTKLQKGESIAPELLQAIEGSRIFVAVFSKNYASSTWCLRELAKILDCVQVSGKLVLPIFYDVDPSKVRKQSGGFEKAFAEHEERFKEDLEKMEEVQRWREVLEQVANLFGWDIQNK
ncbi:disease resistance protein RPV1-like [Gastrolobium bilobum]|uniref:disease resistance protein RPV1-like n=1 Tax=Gastrolobium bilobum TaxID=150636 RepID=UPI002AB0F2A8|nr:disease resistance protein RPV1-like [Gastrolobium bilobum]